MPFLWAAIGAIVSAYFSERWAVRVVRQSLLASFIPMARDPVLAEAYVHSTGISSDPKAMEMFHRLLDEVRTEMAAGHISFSMRGTEDGLGLSVPLLSSHPADAAAGGGVDVSSGEPIVHTNDGYWVWGRGCTEPGGGIAPAWGFVRT